jgi:RecB family exonuclease
MSEERYKELTSAEIEEYGRLCKMSGKEALEHVENEVKIQERPLVTHKKTLKAQNIPNHTKDHRKEIQTVFIRKLKESLDEKV